MSIKEHVKSMVKSVILLDKRRNRIKSHQYVQSCETAQYGDVDS